MNFKNSLLILASLIFYAYGEPVYVLLMVISAGFNYILARIIAISRHRYKKVFLFASVVFNLGVLIYFKYAPFFTVTWNQVSGMDLTAPSVKLPVGISFFYFPGIILCN